MIGENLIYFFGTEKTYLSPSDPECVIYILIIAVLLYYFIHYREEIFSYEFGNLPGKEWYLSRWFLYFSFIIFMIGFFIITLDRTWYGAITGLSFLFASLLILFLLLNLSENGWINGKIYFLIFSVLMFVFMVFTVTYALRKNSASAWIILIISYIFILIFFIYISFFYTKFIRFSRKKEIESIIIKALEKNNYNFSVKKPKKNRIPKIRKIIKIKNKNILIYTLNGMVIISQNLQYKEEIWKIMKIIDIEMSRRGAI